MYTPKKLIWIPTNNEKMWTPYVSAEGTNNTYYIMIGCICVHVTIFDRLKNRFITKNNSPLLFHSEKSAKKVCQLLENM